jgi:hypothetical protein
MVQQPVEHRRRQYRVAGEGLIPRPEGQVRGQDHRALLVALGDDLEEQIGLLTAQRQITDLVDVNSLWTLTVRCIASFQRPWRYAVSIVMTRSAAVVKRTLWPCWVAR